MGIGCDPRVRRDPGSPDTLQTACHVVDRTVPADLPRQIADVAMAAGFRPHCFGAAGRSTGCVAARKWCGRRTAATDAVPWPPTSATSGILPDPEDLGLTDRGDLDARAAQRRQLLG